MELQPRPLRRHLQAERRVDVLNRPGATALISLASEDLAAKGLEVRPVDETRIRRFLGNIPRDTAIGQE